MVSSDQSDTSKPLRAELQLGCFHIATYLQVPGLKSSTYHSFSQAVFPEKACFHFSVSK